MTDQDRIEQLQRENAQLKQEMIEVLALSRSGKVTPPQKQMILDLWRLYHQVTPGRWECSTEALREPDLIDDVRVCEIRVSPDGHDQCHECLMLMVANGPEQQMKNAQFVASAHALMTLLVAAALVE